MLPSRLYSSIELRGKRKKKRVGARDHLGTRREGSASASIPNFHRQYSIRTSYLPFPSGLRTQASRLGEKFASEKIVLEIPKHVALDHPRTFRCPYITRSTSLRCVRLSRDDESRPGRTQLILSDGYGPRPASSAHSAFVFLQRGVQKLVSNPTNIQSAVMWGGAIGCGALWLTQPFDYIKSVLTSKPDADQ